MSNWECGVCNYIHKEEPAPEKCPACEAPQKMFFEQGTNTQGDTIGVAQEVVEPQEVDSDSAEPAELKTWRCTVSGTLHTGPTPPEKCPVCEATADKFEEVGDDQSDSTEAVVRRWRCEVCGYIHEGDQPPEKCPICAAPASVFVEIDRDGKLLSKPEKQTIEPLSITSGKSAEKTETAAEAPATFLDKIGDLVLKFHLHPITVHFPNGILPAVFVFLAIAVYFELAVLEAAAFFNLIVVLITLPVVLLTGYLEWQKRYKGLRTAIFITKIISALTVLASVNVLVFWRLIDPQVASAGSENQLIYFGIAGVALAAAGVAGHLGGKLTFAGRG
jgi:rubrerythrin/uncharacterized membrane protein